MASTVEELLLVIDNDNHTFVSYNEGICQSKYGQVWMYISNDLHQLKKISILMNYMSFVGGLICVWYPKTMKLGVSKPCFPHHLGPSRGRCFRWGMKIFVWHLAFGKLTVGPVGPWKWYMFLVETHLQTPICQGLCEFTGWYPRIDKCSR